MWIEAANPHQPDMGVPTRADHDHSLRITTRRLLSQRGAGILSFPYCPQYDTIFSCLLMRIVIPIRLYRYLSALYEEDGPNTVVARQSDISSCFSFWLRRSCACRLSYFRARKVLQAASGYGASHHGIPEEIPSLKISGRACGDGRSCHLHNLSSTQAQC